MGTIVHFSYSWFVYTNVEKKEQNKKTKKYIYLLNCFSQVSYTYISLLFTLRSIVITSETQINLCLTSSDIYFSPLSKVE